MLTSSAFGFRYDCFVVWPHGLIYLDDILKSIEDEQGFEILKVKRFRSKNIKKFVEFIYSYDYAPKKHIRSKTKYLMNIGNEVCFVFVKNFTATDTYLDFDRFRHSESMGLKELKDKIRSKFNPRLNGELSHDHIIHATDNSDQTSKIIDFLGYQSMHEYLGSRISIIECPNFIEKSNQFILKRVAIDSLVAGIACGESWCEYKIKTVRISETPHFKFLNGNVDIYSKYITKYLGGPIEAYHSISKYSSLIKSFSYHEEHYIRAIIVKNEGDKYIILDGLHRASILLHNGEKEILVCQI